ncbi:hypothetical protein [Capnocytophaga bilenii]
MFSLKVSNAFPRWCELAARTPIRQFHPKVIKKLFLLQATLF